MAPDISRHDETLCENLLPLSPELSSSPFHIVVRDASSGEVVCRVAGLSPSSPISPLTYGVKSPDPALGGKSASEVLEVIRDLTGCTHPVLMDGPKVGDALVFTRSDRILPGTYYLHQPGQIKTEAPTQTHSLLSRIAAVLIALITLGALMQSVVFLLVWPNCGSNVRCILSSYKSFISHIDGPFKIFAFVAAIQRAAANPSIWLGGFQKLGKAFGGAQSFRSRQGCADAATGKAQEARRLGEASPGHVKKD